MGENDKTAGNVLQLADHRFAISWNGLQTNFPTFVLEGLLEQQTGLNPTEIMTDTAGSSDLIFGLFWLLGYQFSPRLADAGASVFWRVDKDADYGVLDRLFKKRT